MNEIGLLCCNVNLDFNLDNGLPHSSSTIQIWNRWEKSFHLRFSWQTKVQTSVETRTFLLFFLILFFADYVVIWKSICTIGRTSLVNEKNLSKVPQDVRKKNLQVWQNWNISIKMRVKPQKNNFGGHFNSHILRLIWFWIMSPLSRGYFSTNCSMVFFPFLDMYIFQPVMTRKFKLTYFFLQKTQFFDFL